MSLKDLFSDNSAIKGETSKSNQKSSLAIESVDLLKSKIVEKNKNIPNIDYEDPKNFAKYGLAEKYYFDAFSYISNQYPYDGSLFEKLSWELSATFLEKYIFENKYPRTTGYAIFGNNYGNISSISNDYGIYGEPQYILFKGGPHTASGGMIGLDIADTFDYSNEYNSSLNRENNLKIDGNEGISFEFWLSRGAFVSGSESPKQVVFDLWNSQSFSSDQYGRFRVEIHPGVSGQESQLYVELNSGSSGLSAKGSTLSIGSSLSLTSSIFHHYHLRVKNSGSNLQALLFEDGELNQTILTGSSIGEITGSMLGTVGALLTNVSSTHGEQGQAKLSGSIDEIRFWKVARSNEQIQQYWKFQVGGGSNTDTANTNLGLYYKFNEGIYNISEVNSYDSSILDYSGRISNGTWIGYVTGSRSTGSAMESAGVISSEFQDPIIYLNHPSVSLALEQLIETGSFHDLSNNAGIFNSFPEWITEADLKKDRNVLLNLTQIMASFFDSIHLQIEEVSRMKEPRYFGSGSLKPYTFMDRFIENYGLLAPDIFQDASELEALGNRSETKQFEEQFFNIKNKIYNNIYNNIVHIFKSKGTEKSLRNLVRCFGVDENLIDIRIYSNDSTYKFEDERKITSFPKKFVDFNHPDRFDACVYQISSSL